MRKLAFILGGIAGAIVLIIGAVFIYAAANLNSIIAQNRDAILERASSALGRQVQVAEIKAQLGWGVSADLGGIKVADDSDFSSSPFVTASDIYVKLELLPLLSRQIRVTKVVLEQPEVHIIRNADGQLNVSTIGKKSERQAAEPGTRERKGAGGAINESPLSVPPERAKPGAVAGLEVHDFDIHDGKVVYAAAGQPPLALSHIDLEVRNFGFNAPFDISLRMAALGEDQNVKLSGSAGPIATAGGIDPNEIPLDLKLQAGPVSLADARKVEFAKAIPTQLQVSDNVSVDAAIKGKVGAPDIQISTDLSSNQIAYGDSFQKPAGVPLKVDVDASRAGGSVAVSKAKVTLADLNLTATKIKLGAGTFGGRVDSNRFDIASLTRLSPSAAKLGITGKSEIHSDVSYAAGKASADGVVTLANVTVPRPGQNGAAAVSDLNGDIRLAGSAANIGPLAFKLGSGSATLSAQADPIYPPKASYEFTASSLRTADFAPKRPADEQLNQVTASGTFSLRDGTVADDDKLTSASGNLNNIPYTGLVVVTSLAGKELRVTQLQIGAFGGSVSGNADASLEHGGSFNAAVTMASLNLQQALESQKAKAAGVVRGLLSGRVQISGRNNGDFDAIKPTLAGNGQAQVAQGKLVGVNIGARVFEKTRNLPVIGSLIPQSIANNHPELFKSPDTDFEQMGLTFTIQGPRITSHDLLMKTADYALKGDGWFDMDKNVDMTARILLTQQLTREIIAQKKNVVYVTDNNGEIDIPLRITGQLPKPAIMPDVTELAQRATQHAVQEQGQKALEKALGNKGIGKFLGGGSPNGTNQPSNPLNQLKGLFGR